MTTSENHIPTALPGTGLSQRFRFPRTVFALMLREMSTRYGRSPGGYLWALLEPVGGIIILGYGFSLLVRTPPLGSDFFLFFATGFMPFNIYQTISLLVARSITFSKPLLFYPSVTWVDSVVARFVLNALTSIMVAYIVLGGFLLVVDTRTTLDVGPILLSGAMALLLGLGLGVLNCALIGLISVWDTVWSIITRPLFLASGVIILLEDLPRGVQDILWYNPLYHVTGAMRAGFYPSYEPTYVSPLFVVFVSLISLAMGVILLSRYHRHILNNR